MRCHRTSILRAGGRRSLRQRDVSTPLVRSADDRFARRSSIGELERARERAVAALDLVEVDASPGIGRAIGAPAADGQARVLERQLDVLAR